MIHYSDDWAMAEHEESGDRILRALAKAWRHAQHIPQNLQQHRAAILLPAIEARLAELAQHPTSAPGSEQNASLLAAAKTALYEMRHTIAPRNSFTDAVDALDAAISAKEAP